MGRQERQRGFVAEAQVWDSTGGSREDNIKRLAKLLADFVKAARAAHVSAGALRPQLFGTRYVGSDHQLNGQISHADDALRQPQQDGSVVFSTETRRMFGPPIQLVSYHLATIRMKFGELTEANSSTKQA